MRTFSIIALEAAFRLTSIVVASASLLACSPSTASCDDLLPLEVARYPIVSEMFTASGSKGCVQCHNTREPVYGLNFEGPAVTFDALTTRFDVIYDQLETGRMPQGGVRWSRDDLRILRSWYCQGAVYESP